MQQVLYDGTFEGFLCAVFDIYEYRFADAVIYTTERHQEALFSQTHCARPDRAHALRVWRGLRKKLMAETLEKLHRCFLSELPGVENTLLDFIRYAFASERNMEADFSHAAVVAVTQIAKKVAREKHRMEAFVRFERTADDLFFSFIEPDYNVLPLIAPHFKTRYADQRWLIYDPRRKYGIFYDLQDVSEVQLDFSEVNRSERSSFYDAGETIYQQLWRQYFSSTNIAARKNTRLHVRHMPKRYWRYLTEKTGDISG